MIRLSHLPRQTPAFPERLRCLTLSCALALSVYPFGGSTSVEYNNQVSGVFANARYQLGDSDWYTGPRLSYRTSDISLNAAGRWPT